MTKDLQKRVIFGGIALAFFIPVVLIGGVVFQIVVGLIAQNERTSDGNNRRSFSHAGSSGTDLTS